MRCLLVVTGLAYGGAETQVVHLATRLKARNWEVQVVSLMPPKAYVEDLEAQGIPVTTLGIQRKIPDPRPILRLAWLIRAWKPHIIHSHMVHANILARLVRPLTSAPVLICTAHNIDERGQRGTGRLRILAYRSTDFLCDLTTQVSKAGLEHYVRIGAVPWQKIRYIPNGVDTKRFCPDPETRIRLRQALELGVDFTWLAVGRFDPPKDYPNLLRSFTRVTREQPGALLLIAGDGPLRPAMEEAARGLGIADRVQFLGIRQDIPALMNAADAYVMSSAWEGTPMVLLEASATELPIVATDVGGNREVVLNGRTGILVPPHDSEALAKAMLQVMGLPDEKRRRMGEAARQHIETNFSLDQVVDRWEALYRDLLAQKRVRVE